MTLVADFIRKMADDLKCEDFCDRITKIIATFYVFNGIDLQTLAVRPEERLCASAVIYNRYRRQIWMIGDCACLVDGILYDNPKPYESGLAERRARLIQESAQDLFFTPEALMDHDTARDAILPSLIEAMRDENKTYAVIDGFPIYNNGVKIIELEDSVKEIVLASDGYPFLLPSLEESEAALQRQLAEDPLCIRTFKATKGLMNGQVSFDDRAYLRIRV